MNFNLIIITALIVIALASCNTADYNSTSTTDPSTHIFDAFLMNSNNLLESVTLVNATLTDGTTVKYCCEIFRK